MPTSIQRLYETCKEVFGDLEAGTVPAPEDVNRLKAVLDNMNASDVGLNPTLPYFWKIELEGNPPITYLRIYECEKFSICIFCLPPKGVIPLHNHPGMTVFSKLLFGNMHVKSCDWADSHPSSQESVNTSHRLAEVKTDKLLTAPCESSVLYPNDGGNMHCFTAMTPCAVLDVLGPPYSDPDGRRCTYYDDLPYVDTNVAPGENVKYTWLEEREKAEDFFVLGAKYRGPTIKEN
ncbi:plant cysteine oxidase 2-like isoform X2 [Asparagus officinalis]|nr:plant cysteine oxidase 2-like isoform X2 [Asparagus officinalis]